MARNFSHESEDECRNDAHNQTLAMAEEAIASLMQANEPD